MSSPAAEYPIRDSVKSTRHSANASWSVMAHWICVGLLPILGCVAPGGKGVPADGGPIEPCPTYFFEGIRDLPGDIFASAASDISDDGLRVVGHSWADDENVEGDGSAGYPHGYQAIGWTRPCEKDIFFHKAKVVLPPRLKVPGLIGLGYLLPSIHPESNAHGISPDGRVVVGFATSGTDNHLEAVELRPLGPEPLHRIPTDVSCAARDVSDENPALLKNLPGLLSSIIVSKGFEPRVIVGWSSTANQHPHLAPGSKAVFWSVSKYPWVLPVPTRLPNGAAIVSSEATSVSSDGTVIAGNLFYDDGTGSGFYSSYGATWVRINGTYVLKGILLGQSGAPQLARVIRISGDGKVVVGFCLNAASEPIACAWSTNGGGPKLLPLLSSTGNSAAFGVNVDGSVIVGYCGSYTDAAPWFDHKATIWSGGIVSDVAVLLKSAGAVVPADWVLECRAVSNKGKRIAGWGYHRDYDRPEDPEAFVEEGWVAHIP